MWRARLVAVLAFLAFLEFSERRTGSPQTKTPYKSWATAHDEGRINFMTKTRCFRMRSSVSGTHGGVARRYPKGSSPEVVSSAGEASSGALAASTGGSHDSREALTGRAAVEKTIRGFPRAHRENAPGRETREDQRQSASIHS